MGEVLDINKNKPFSTGPARCLHCGHGWIAVAPVPLTTFDCPSCGLSKGVWQGLVVPNEPIYMCVVNDCGNDVFWLLRDCTMCTKCGVMHYETDDGPWQA